MHSSAPNERLNETELAERWKISPRTLQRWRGESIGPTYLKLGSRVAYRLCDIIQYEHQSLFRGSGERASPTSH